jgi:hypothetical protein
MANISKAQPPQGVQLGSNSSGSAGTVDVCRGGVRILLQIVDVVEAIRGDQLCHGKWFATQLAAPTWKLRGNTIVIESKDVMRKRLGASTRRSRHTSSIFIAPSGGRS